MRRRLMLDPLTGGLASRVYLAAFPKPRSAYEIAKMVVPNLPRNASGRRTVVSKVEGLMGEGIASFAEVAVGAALWETLTNLCKKVSSAAPLPLRIASSLIQFALL